jgi:hypothetical protein
LEPKEKQALKLAEIREALVAAGYDTTAKQGGILGLGQSRFVCRGSLQSIIGMKFFDANSDTAIWYIWRII